MAVLFSELRERLLRAGVAPRHVRRYLRELTDHLADLTAEEERAGRGRAEAESAALLRLGGMDDLMKAMTQPREFQSWCVRAPWVTFGLAPLLLLAAAWFVALFALWFGWKTFLPGADTPFGSPNYGLANLYFQLDRAFYYSSPILIGWGIGLIAVRQRVKAVWPVAGLVLIALIGGGTGATRVDAAVPGGTGRISVNLTLGQTDPLLPYALLHALVILCLVLPPYLIWGSRRRFFAKLTLFCVLAGATFGQGAKPEFDVADIKQNKSSETGVEGGLIPGGQLSIRNAPLKTLPGKACPRFKADSSAPI
jgi:hypothetical protein